ncbi:hypothetical protein LEMLEM_LOCUS621 [Lemmus lemmus]
MQMPSLKPFLHRRKTKTKTLSRYRMKPCGFLLSQYGMIDHALLNGCSEHLQKITSLNC